MEKFRAFAAITLMGTVIALVLTAFAFEGMYRVPLTAKDLKANRIERGKELTIRVNTFRRNDLLDGFLEYYGTRMNKGGECAFIKQIQVVWSDLENEAPLEMAKKYAGGSGSDRNDRIFFEKHSKNSLNNRFIPTGDVPTEAVLSIDDDLLVPCPVLYRSLNVWASFDKALVGYTGRMHAQHPGSGQMRYLRWQHTWWSGIYSVMLTKVAFLHRDYLIAFPKLVPQEFLDHVDRGRNCEDLAMAYVVVRLIP